jgi:hypothetical protein
MTLAELRTHATTDIYTVQRKRVVDRFKRGETHVQLREHTAPDDQALDERHRKVRTTSDIWMSRQFEARMGRSAEGPLIWVYLDGNHFWKNVDRIRKHDDEYVVHLRVPVEEMLLSNRGAWQRLLMEIEGDPLDALLASNAGVGNADEIRSEWEAEVFNISESEEISRLQAVIDRIESDWIRGVQPLGFEAIQNPSDLESKDPFE